MNPYYWNNVMEWLPAALGTILIWLALMLLIWWQARRQNKRDEAFRKAMQTPVRYQHGDELLDEEEHAARMRSYADAEPNRR